MAAISGRLGPRNWLALVAREPVLSILVVALVALQIAQPQPVAVLVRLVDWQTVATLAGLLMVTKTLEMSGFLMWLAHRIVHRVRSERSLAMLLIVFSAVLATWLTNDVALFVAVPLVVSLHKLTPLPLKRLVICLAIAVNAGSIATPLGNPQNLFLWQRSGTSFGRFVAELGPLALMTMLMLLVLAACMFRSKSLDFSGDAEAYPVRRPLAAAAVLLFAGFVLAVDGHHAMLGVIGVAVILGVLHRDAVLRIDWLLLVIFVLMFVVLRGAAALPGVSATLARLDLDAPLRLYTAGAVLSQGISNVPAAILLSEFGGDWRALAFGVNVGGLGFAIGSLANLIAVRLARTRGIWLPFHFVCVPFGLVAFVIGGIWLRYI